MKLFILLTLLSCSHKSPRPSWVDGVASGEERLQVKNGDKLLFRRVASTCEQATVLIEQDIQLSGYYPVPEHVYQDSEICALTYSTSSKLPQNVSSNPVAALSKRAVQNAYTGLKEAEFEAAVKDRVILDIDYRNMCWQNFHKSGASYHGSTTVCWRMGQIVGYCLQEGCYTK